MDLCCWECLNKNEATVSILPTLFFVLLQSSVLVLVIGISFEFIVYSKVAQRLMPHIESFGWLRI